MYGWHPWDPHAAAAAHQAHAAHAAHAAAAWSQWGASAQGGPAAQAGAAWAAAGAWAGAGAGAGGPSSALTRASRFDEGPCGASAAARGVAKWSGGGKGEKGGGAEASRPSRFDEGAPRGVGGASRWDEGAGAKGCGGPPRWDEGSFFGGSWDEGGPQAAWGGSSWGGASWGGASWSQAKGGISDAGSSTSQVEGTIKSYSAVKGFGFVLHPSIVGDIWFAREACAPELRDANLAPGDPMTFELSRTLDGKPQARNLKRAEAPMKGGGQCFGGFPGAGKGFALRPMYPGPLGAKGGMLGGPRPIYTGMSGKGIIPLGSMGVMPGKGAGASILMPKGVGWLPQKRALSPHAGSRAIAGASGAKGGEGRGSPSPRRPTSKRSTSSSKASSSSEKRKKKKKKKQNKKKRKKSSSRSRIRSKSGGTISSSVADGPVADSGGGALSVIEEAKKEALAKLTLLQGVEPKEERAKQWRLLLRNWHPDKNPDKSEVATAVFQFLQKGKSLINL